MSPLACKLAPTLASAATSSEGKDADWTDICVKVLSPRAVVNAVLTV